MKHSIYAAKLKEFAPLSVMKEEDIPDDVKAIKRNHRKRVLGVLLVTQVQFYEQVQHGKGMYTFEPESRGSVQNIGVMGYFMTGTGDVMVYCEEVRRDKSNEEMRTSR